MHHTQVVLFCLAVQINSLTHSLPYYIDSSKKKKQLIILKIKSNILLKGGSNSIS